MATALDTKIGPKVVAIIAEVGVSATLTYKASAAYDVTTGLVTEGADVNHTVKVSPPQAYEQTEVDGQSVLSSDAQVYLAGYGLAFVPPIDARITVSGKTWRVMAVSPILSGDLVAAYRLQLRT